MIEGFLIGIAAAFSLTNLAMVVAGCLIGTFIGMLPGLGPMSIIAIMIPVAITIGDPSAALILLAGVYYGAIFGGDFAQCAGGRGHRRHQFRWLSHGAPGAGGQGPHYRCPCLFCRRHSRCVAADGVCADAVYPRVAVSFGRILRADGGGAFRHCRLCRARPYS